MVITLDEQVASLYDSGANINTTWKLSGVKDCVFQLWRFPLQRKGVKICFQCLFSINSVPTFLQLSHSDITLRYKETRRRKQEVPTDRDRPLGNGNTATPSGRSKLNGSSETVRQRKSWREVRVATGRSAADVGKRIVKVWWKKWGDRRIIMTQRHMWRQTDGHVYVLCTIFCAYINQVVI